MRITITTGPARRQPKIGDRRTTKKHGLQIRVVETHHGMWVRSGSRYRYDWKLPQDLLNTQWEHLLTAAERASLLRPAHPQPASR